MQLVYPSEFKATFLLVGNIPNQQIDGIQSHLFGIGNISNQLFVATYGTGGRAAFRIFELLVLVFAVSRDRARVVVHMFDNLQLPASILGPGARALENQTIE